MKTKHIFFSILLLALLVMYFSDAFLQGRIFSERDLPVFHHPYSYLLAECIRSGQMPLWNPFIMCGEPLLANVQPVALYPLSIIYLFFSLDTAFNLTILLHFFLAGVFTFMLLKEMDASDEAAAISAVAFVFSGFLLSLHTLLSTLHSVTWVPLVIALYLRSIRKNSVKHAVLCGLAVYALFSGSGLDIVIMMAVILPVICFFPYLHGDAGVATGPAKRIGYGMVAGGCFLMVGAAQILPFFELVGNSSRSEGINYIEAVTWSLAPGDLVNLFVPDIFNRGGSFYWEDQSWLKTIYTGFIPFMLGAFVLFEGGKRRALLICILFAALVLCLGKYNPFYPFLFNWLPVLQKTRYPVKFFFVFAFFLSIASGLGWDHFKANIKARGVKRFTALLFFVFGFLMSLVFMAVSLYPDMIYGWLQSTMMFAESKFTQDEILHNMKRVMVFGILGSTWIYVVMRKQWARPFGFYGIAAVLVCDLFLGNFGFSLSCDRETLRGNPGNLGVLVKDEGLYRVFSSPKVKKGKAGGFENQDEYLKMIQNALVPNLLTERNRFDISGFSVLSLKNYYKIFTLIQSAPLPDTTNLLNMMNVKYVLWYEALDRPGYELVRKDGDLFLYQNNNCFQRAFLAKNYRVPATEEAFRLTLQSLEFDPSQTVLLKKHPETFPFPFKKDPPAQDSVHITEYKYNSVKVNVVSRSSQFLVLSDTFFEGWKAYVNGAEAPLYEANFAFRAVAVPPGRHTVLFRYEPGSFRLGAVISLAALSLLAVLLVIGIIRKKR